MLDDYEEKDINEEGNLNTQKVEDKFILKKFRVVKLAIRIIFIRQKNLRTFLLLN